MSPYMPNISLCPHCRKSYAVYIERDQWGEWRVCLYCGWEQFLEKIPSEEPEARFQRLKKGRELVSHGTKL